MKADPEGSLEYFASVDEADDDLKPSAKMLVAKDAREMADILKANNKVVVDFVAPWCGKCKQVSQAAPRPTRECQCHTKRIRSFSSKRAWHVSHPLT